VTFEKAPEEMTNHLRPLYIRAHIDGKAVSTVLVDNASLVGGSRAEEEDKFSGLADFSSIVFLIPMELGLGPFTPAAARGSTYL